MQIEFKPAEIGDLETLTNLRREFHEFEPFPNPLDDAENERVLRLLLSNEKYGKIWLIHLAKDVCGYVAVTFGFSLEYAGQTVLLDELFVREEFRHLGIGTQTLRFIEDFCRAENIRVVQLEVEHENLIAKDFYRRNNFVDYERRFLSKWIK